MIIPATQYELENLIGIIYIICNKINNKKYVGQSNLTFNQRYKGGRWWKISDNKHLKSSFLKYGIENFEIWIMGRNIFNQDALDDLEDFYIELYHTRDPRYGYNKNPGGSYGKHSAETKRKLSIIGKINNKGERNPMFGKHHSQETKELVSKLAKERYRENGHHLRGIKLSEEAKNKMAKNKIGKGGKQIKQIDAQTGNVIKIWNCIAEAARSLTGKTLKYDGKTFESALISNVCAKRLNKNGAQFKTAYGYKWEYVENNEK